MSTELAWAAGLFDGEGSTFVWKGNRRRDYGSIRVAVGQSHDPEVLRRFQQAVSLGRVYGPYGGERKFQYHASNREGCEVLRKLAPYLSGPKKKQARVALERYNMALAGRRQYGGHPRHEAVKGITDA